MAYAGPFWRRRRAQDFVHRDGADREKPCEPKRSAFECLRSHFVRTGTENDLAREMRERPPSKASDGADGGDVGTTGGNPNKRPFSIRMSETRFVFA
jgi:hypothetical protein